MAYSKQSWADGPSGGTPISAERLGHIEDGIEAAAETADAALPKTGGTVTSDLTVAGMLNVSASASMTFGSSADVNLYRAGADTLGTDDSLLVSGDIQGFGDLEVAGTIQANGVTDWVNVKTYGATGDGTTDDTEAIQNAIDAVASGGGVVYLPEGTYKLSSALTVNSDLHLRGAGDACTILVQSATDENGLTGVDVSRLAVTNLKLLGPASGTGIGISLSRSTNDAITYSTFADLYVASFGGDGINISNPIVSTFSRVICETNGGHGFNLHGVEGGAAGTSCSLMSCYANGNTGTGIRLFKMVYTSLSGCAADSNATGYEIDTCQSVALSGCGAESQVGDSFVVSAGFGVTLVSCWSYDNHGDAFKVDASATAATLVGCTEIDPDEGATGGVVVESGSTATLINCHTTTADALSGTVTELDAAGNAAVPGTLSLTGGVTINFGADVNLYRADDDTLGTDDSLAVSGALQHWGDAAGFFGTAAVSKPEVTGSTGSNAALESLLSALENLGLITDSSTG